MITNCPTCGTQLPTDSGVCPRCAGDGALARDETQELARDETLELAHDQTQELAHGETLELPADPVEPNPQLESSVSDRPPNVHVVQRQPFGVHPVPLLTGLAVISLLLGIVLLGVGALAGGAVILVLALVLFALLRLAVRREPDAPLAPMIGQAIDRWRSGWKLVGVYVLTAWRAAVNLLRIRGRQWRLRSELQDHLRPLGEAIYRDEHTRAQALKQRASEIDQQLRASEREAAAVAEAARQKIRRERAASQPTEVISTPPE